MVYIFLSFYFKKKILFLTIASYLKWVSCWRYIIGSFKKIHSDSLCLLINIFKAHLLTVTMNFLDSNLLYHCLFSFCPLCFSSLCFPFPNFSVDYLNIFSILFCFFIVIFTISLYSFFSDCYKIHTYFFTVYFESVFYHFN